ncbi:lysine exporter protein LysE/YggA [Nitritalea halalkaliphila LW7]|uniref:Lysine exporter protein LysE/YggA n=1 Tax=Nitritalea halalkaliphila LW7 TaxID=1189621 RepID=I5C3P2_9BACT|nr:LysE family translocator [Nitritalea halalkaliphila]EIM76444.1 lysine exporter protein LysE/YggA [Nitritalea halalkaliphila LW7]
MQSLQEGLLMGLVLSSMIGPVFFTLIQSSLERGFRYAALVATGILLSDMAYVLATYWGVSRLQENPYLEVGLGYGGALVLLGFALSAWWKKQSPRPNSGGLLPKSSGKKSALLKGFGVNGINPFVLLFWLSIAGFLHLKDKSPWDTTAYYGGILGTVFSIDLLKAYAAKQLSPFLNDRRMYLLNKAVAIGMLGFALRLFWFAYQKQLLLGTTP